MSKANHVDAAFKLASELYEAQGVDLNAALQRLSNVAISVHCWQGDDVAGFEGGTGTLGDGLPLPATIQRARTADELRSDLEVAYSLIPGQHRLNLHCTLWAKSMVPSIVTRSRLNTIGDGWIGHETEYKIGFQPELLLAFPKHRTVLLWHMPMQGVRQFWIDHGIACRQDCSSHGCRSGATPASITSGCPMDTKTHPQVEKLRGRDSQAHSTRYSPMTCHA